MKPLARLSTLAAPDRELVEAARDVRRRAHAPYSGFRVGAAIRTRDGRIFHGCNVENACHGAGICAERGAILQAVAAGMRRGQLDAVAVYTRDEEPTPPCGVCLQVIVEFARDASVLLANARGVRRTTLRSLLPMPFTSYPSAPESSRSDKSRSSKRPSANKT